MNEPKVEDMKAQFAIRQSRIHTMPKLELRVAAPKQILFSRMRSRLGSLWKRISMRRSDLDMEAWRALEYRNDYVEPRDPKRLDINRWI